MDYFAARVHPDSFIARNATIVGEVEVGANCTILYNATLRGDCGGRVVLGAGSNVQEGACVHVPIGGDTLIGENVTVGHGAIVHGCSIGDGTIVGMGAIVIDGARVGRNCLIGAGALVTGKADIPGGMLVLGSPARAVRPLTEDELRGTLASAEEYQKVGKDLAAQGLLAYGSEVSGAWCAGLAE